MAADRQSRNRANNQQHKTNNTLHSTSDAQPETNNVEADNPELEVDNESSNEETQQCAHRRSKSSRADTLSYYQGSNWKTVLERAKINYRRYISLYHAFPTRDKHLDKARKVLIDTIVECQEDGFILNDRTCISFY
jgi:hypothetical protein